MRPFTLCLLLALAVSGCGKGYKGSGAFHGLKRTYIPGVAETEGYMVEMPIFSADTNTQATYSLEGLPRLNTGFDVQLLTFIPESVEVAQKQSEINGAIPSTHEVHCALIDKRTNRILAEKTEKVTKLPGTPTPFFLLGPFLKCFFQVSFTNVLDNAEMELRFEYRPGGLPFKRNMKVIILNDAPTA